jgi:hypothetical protein
MGQKLFRVLGPTAHVAVAIPPHACVMFAVNATQARIGTSSFVFDARCLRVVRAFVRSRVRARAYGCMMWMRASSSSVAQAALPRGRCTALARDATRRAHRARG